MSGAGVRGGLRPLSVGDQPGAGRTGEAFPRVALSRRLPAPSPAPERIRRIELRLSGWKPVALPLSYIRVCVALTGFEPAISRLRISRPGPTRRQRQGWERPGSTNPVATPAGRY